MALFKICRCKEENLPSSKKDGYTYFCTDTGNFYIDWANETGAIDRIHINANYANNIRYLDGSEYVELEASAIVSHVSNTNNPHKVTTTQIDAVPTSRTINGKKLTGNIVLNATDIGLDSSLSKSGYAADAKATGYAIDTLSNEIIPVSRGGTGVTDAGSIRGIIGLGKTTGTLSVKYGGTGGTTASAARNNLGAQAQHIQTNVTLLANGWSNNSQAVKIDEVTESNTVIIAPAPENHIAYGKCGIYCTTQNSGKLTFICGYTPSENIVVNVAIF